ncbi:hypothetical protein ACU8KH_00281 [Lachancea thermotolerans]
MSTFMSTSLIHNSSSIHQLTKSLWSYSHLGSSFLALKIARGLLDQCI